MALALRTPAWRWISRNKGTLEARINHLTLGGFSVMAAVDFGALGLAGAPAFYGLTASNDLATDGGATLWRAAVAALEPQT